MRSPSSAPSVNGELGSIDSTATWRSRSRTCSTSRPISVDLPTPGGPVKPAIAARPVRGYTSRTSAHPSGSSFSTSEIARASARLSPASSRSDSSAAVRPGAGIGADSKGRRSTAALAQVLGDVPRPQLHDVAVRIPDVRRPSVRIAEAHHLDVLAASADQLDRRVEVRVGDLHREVHVHAAAASSETDLRTPESDPRALAGHNPDRLAVVRSIHDRQPEHA